MSDIVELLQKPSWTTRWRNAAADEIEHLMRAHDDMSDTIETLRARVKELEEALRGVVDDEPCYLDHHGYCQTHCLGNPCEMAIARAALKEREK